MLLRLVLGNLFARKTRTVLTCLAVAISVSLVVAMTSGIAAFEKAAMGFMDQYMGSVDATISKTGGNGKDLPQSLLANFSADPRIRSASPRLQSEVTLPSDQPGQLQLGRVVLTGVERGTDPVLEWMKLDAGRWFEPGERAAVIDQSFADRTHTQPGGTVEIVGPHGNLKLPVVGIVHKPGLFAGFESTAYVPLAEAQQFLFGNDNPKRLSQIRLQFKPNIDAAGYLKEITDKLHDVDPQLRVRSTKESRKDMDRNFMTLRLFALLGGAVTLVAAMFIIVSTLSMGLLERQRTLAMLRAVGMTRSGVAKLVMLEGLGLGVIGIAIGTPLGFGLSFIVVLVLRKWFQGISPTLDPLGFAAASAAAMLASLVASLLPAWQATRVDPLEALGAVGQPQRSTPALWPTLAGIAGISLDPLLLFMPLPFEHAREMRFYLHFAIGVPGLMVGFFLLGPVFIYVVSRILTGPLSFLLRLPVGLVKEQFSTGLWRSAGTCTALMVGLAVLTVMQTQGQSSLDSWKLPTRFPDVFLFTKSLSGLSPQQQEKIANSPELVKDDVMPIATFAPEVGPGIFGLLGTRLPGNTMFVAIDPAKGFRLMELDFRQGSADESAKLLGQGGYVLITEEFHKLKNLNKGDTLQLKSYTKGLVEFKIAGVVWSPGIDVMVNSFDLAQQAEQQSMACVFGSLDDAKKDFGVTNVYLMCANFKQLGLPKENLLDALRKELGDNALHIADVRMLKSTIESGMRHMLTAASLIAWGALLVASLGVTNTVIAGIRTRMWQFGILRAIGLPRGALVRMVFVEALLIGGVGAAMGLTCGGLMTIDARQILTLTIGHHPALSVPWTTIGLGASAVILVSLLASIVPALRLARTQPLTLLQAGRSAS